MGSMTARLTQGDPVFKNQTHKTKTKHQHEGIRTNLISNTYILLTIQHTLCPPTKGSLTKKANKQTKNPKTE